MRAATTSRRRATGMMLAAALTLCSCGGVLGFVSPSVAVGRVSAAAAGERTARGATAAAAVASATERPRALPRLHAAKGPPGPAGGTDFMDSIAGGGEREMTTEEKVAALQREVQAQVALADGLAAEEEEEEGGEGGEEEKKEVVEIPSVEAEQDAPPEEEEQGPVKDGDFVAAADFVDEGKNILWPNPRRAAQLTLLAVVAQIAFIVYIISLNTFLKSFPLWFEKFVEIVKAGDIRLPDL